MGWFAFCRVVDADDADDGDDDDEDDDDDGDDFVGTSRETTNDTIGSRHWLKSYKLKCFGSSIQCRHVHYSLS